MLTIRFAKAIVNHQRTSCDYHVGPTAHCLLYRCEAIQNQRTHSRVGHDDIQQKNERRCSVNAMARKVPKQTNAASLLLDGCHGQPNADARANTWAMLNEAGTQAQHFEFYDEGG